MSAKRKPDEPAVEDAPREDMKPHLKPDAKILGKACYHAGQFIAKRVLENAPMDDEHPEKYMDDLENNIAADLIRLYEHAWDDGWMHGGQIMRNRMVRNYSAGEDAKPRTPLLVERLIEIIEECTMLLAEVHLAFPQARHDGVTLGAIAQMFETEAKKAHAALVASTPSPRPPLPNERRSLIENMKAGYLREGQVDWEGLADAIFMRDRRTPRTPLRDLLKSYSKRLRKAAEEIAVDGHAGWGNTCSQSADAIDAALRAATPAGPSIDDVCKGRDRTGQP